MSDKINGFEDGSHAQKPEPALKQEKVEDRPNVSVVAPEDYPEDQRASGKLVTGEGVEPAAAEPST